MDAGGDNAREAKCSFRRVCVGLRPGASPCGNAPGRRIPPAGISGSLFRSGITPVFKKHFRKSTRVAVGPYFFWDVGGAPHDLFLAVYYVVGLLASVGGGKHKRFATGSCFWLGIQGNSVDQIVTEAFR